jgi:hypothetical protein
LFYLALTLFNALAHSRGVDLKAILIKNMCTEFQVLTESLIDGILTVVKVKMNDFLGDFHFNVDKTRRNRSYSNSSFKT